MCPSPSRLLTVSSMSFILNLFSNSVFMNFLLVMIALPVFFVIVLRCLRFLLLGYVFSMILVFLLLSLVRVLLISHNQMGVVATRILQSQVAHESDSSDYYRGMKAQAW